MDAGGKKSTSNVFIMQQPKGVPFISGKVVAFSYGFITAFMLITVFHVFTAPMNTPSWFSQVLSSSRTNLTLPSSSSLPFSSYVMLPKPDLFATTNFHVSGDVREAENKPVAPKMDRRDDANQQEPSNVPSRSAAVTSTEASETRSASEPEVALRNVLAAHRRRRSDPESKQESVGGHLTMVGNMQSGEVSDGESRSPGSSGVSPAAVGDDTRISINANIKDDGNRRSGWRTKTAASSAGRRTETGTASRKGAESEKPKFAEPIGREKLRTECDLFDGRWVRDESYPYYPAGSCPYVETPTSCYQNGRPDRNYEKWRWQPHGCNISRLDPKDMLERLRGKRLAFVGDSLNRNMWRSLICLLWSSLEDKTRMVGVSGQHEYGTTSATVFRFLDYNFTLEFFWSAFLVDEQQISHPNGTVQKKLRLDNMATFASSYRDADILIFNSGHWWVPAKTNDG